MAERNWCKTLFRRRKKETLLYEKKAVVLTGGIDRRSNMPTSPTDRTDSNLDERVTDFFALIGKKNVLQNSN